MLNEFKKFRDIVATRIEPVGKPYRGSAFALNCGLQWPIIRILGRNIQGHGLNRSWLIVELDRSM